jgi:isopentenyl-diphosphate delta-isomerase
MIGGGMSRNKIVSFDSEMLILVDEKDNIIGYKSKSECHKGDGILHRAFSIFIFNSSGELLLQKRSGQKLLWPLFWSNSCCSHPRKGEVLDEAAHRRLEEELNIKTDLEYLYTFQYQELYKNIGAENEMCAVFIGKSNSPARANENEIADWRYISMTDLNKELQSNPDKYTPWFKMEWQKLTTDFIEKIRNL